MHDPADSPEIVPDCTSRPGSCSGSHGTHSCRRFRNHEGVCRCSCGVSENLVERWLWTLPAIPVKEFLRAEAEEVEQIAEAEEIEFRRRAEIERDKEDEVAERAFAERGFITKDSGARREFPTGSLRDVRDGKGRYDLLPIDSIRRIAQLYERGAAKYGDDNWTLGQPLRSFADSMLRHAFQAAAGATDEDHLAAVCFNAMAIMHHQARIAEGTLPAELDDLPKATR